MKGGGTGEECRTAQTGVPTVEPGRVAAALGAAGGAEAHLHGLASLAARLPAGHRDNWLAAWLDELDAGGVSPILAHTQTGCLLVRIASRRWP